jgi:hypothetical protein
MAGDLNSAFEMGSFDSYFQEEDEHVDLHISSIIRIHESLMFYFFLTPEDRHLGARVLFITAIVPLSLLPSQFGGRGLLLLLLRSESSRGRMFSRCFGLLCFR